MCAKRAQVLGDGLSFDVYVFARFRKRLFAAFVQTIQKRPTSRIGQRLKNKFVVFL